MASVRFLKLGGSAVEKEITEEITIRDAIDKGYLAYSKGDTLSINNQKVDLDTKITPDQAQFVTAVPQPRGGY